MEDLYGYQSTFNETPFKASARETMKGFNPSGVASSVKTALNQPISGSKVLARLVPVAKLAGRGVGAAGAGLAAKDIYDNGLNLNNATDLAIGGVGVVNPLLGGALALGKAGVNNFVNNAFASEPTVKPASPTQPQVQTAPQETAVQKIQGNVAPNRREVIATNEAKAQINPIALLRQSLKELDAVKNQGKSATLGEAVSQKVENNQAKDRANLLANAATQIANINLNDVNVRKGNNELAIADNLNKVFTELQAPNLAPDKADSLRNLALTLQGKEPKANFEFKEVGGGTDPNTFQPLPKTLIRANQRTGQVEAVDGQQKQTKPAQDFKIGSLYTIKGQTVKFAGYDKDGTPLWDDGK